MPDIRGLVSDPRFSKFPLADRMAALRKAGADPEFMTRYENLAKVESGDAPALSAGEPSRPEPTTPAETLDRLAGFADMPGSRSTATPVAEEPLNEADLAAVIRGGTQTAMAPLAVAAAPTAAAHPVATAALLPAMSKILEFVKSKGRTAGDRLGIPETGEALTELAAILLPIGGFKAAGALKARTGAAPAAAAAPPAPAPPPAASPSVAENVAGVSQEGAGSGLGARLLEALKPLIPETRRVGWELAGRKLGGMTGVPGAVLFGGRIGRLLSRMVEAERGALTAKGVSTAQADDILVAEIMKSVPGVTREQALKMVSTPGATVAGAPVSEAAAASTPAPAAPRPAASDELAATIDAAVSKAKSRMKLSPEEAASISKESAEVAAARAPKGRAKNGVVGEALAKKKASTAAGKPERRDVSHRPTDDSLAKMAEKHPLVEAFRKGDDLTLSTWDTPLTNTEARFIVKAEPGLAKNRSILEGLGESKSAGDSPLNSMSRSDLITNIRWAADKAEGKGGSKAVDRMWNAFYRGAGRKSTDAGGTSPLDSMTTEEIRRGIRSVADLLEARGGSKAVDRFWNDVYSKKSGGTNPPAAPTGPSGQTGPATAPPPSAPAAGGKQPPAGMPEGEVLTSLKHLWRVEANRPAIEAQIEATFGKARTKEILKLIRESTNRIGAPEGGPAKAAAPPKEMSLEDQLKASLKAGAKPPKGEAPGGGGPVTPSPSLAAAVEEAADAVSGKMLPKSVSTARDALPAPAKGHVRLWRVEGESAKAAGAAAGKPGGAWFERNLGAYATGKTKPGDVKYVDVPEAEFAKLQSDPNATEVTLSKEWVDKARSLSPAKAVNEPGGGMKDSGVMIHGRRYQVGDTVTEGPSKGARVLSIDDGVPTLSKLPKKVTGKGYGDK